MATKKIKTELKEIKIAFSNREKLTVENVQHIEVCGNRTHLHINDGTIFTINTDNINSMRIKPQKEQEAADNGSN